MGRWADDKRGEGGAMESRDGRFPVRGACDDPNREIGLLIERARDLAAYARWALDLLDRTPDDRSEWWRRADAFRDLTEELRNIIRTCHPGLGF